MAKITKEQVLAPILGAVREDPERTNNGECLYTLDGKTPNCIAAVALVGTGVPLDVLHKENSTSIYALTGALPDITARYDTAALDLLDSLQVRADSTSDDDGNLVGPQRWVDVLKDLDIDPGV